MAYPGAPRFAHSTNVIPVYKSILGGTNLLELWHSDYGYSLAAGTEVVSWTGQINSTVITPPSTSVRPLWAADGTNFRGKSVMNFYRSPGRYMARHEGSNYLGSASENTSIFLVGRLRDPSLIVDSTLQRSRSVCASQK